MRNRLALAVLPLLALAGACVLQGKPVSLDPAEVSRQHGEIFARYYCDEGRWPERIDEAESFAARTSLPNSFGKYTGWSLRSVREIELEAKYRASDPKATGEYTSNYLARTCPGGEKDLPGAFSLHGKAFRFRGLKGFAPSAETEVFPAFGPFGLPDISFADPKREIAFGFMFGSDELPMGEVKGLQAPAIAKLLSLSVPEKSFKKVKALRVQLAGRVWRFIEIPDAKKKLSASIAATSFFGRPLGVIVRGPVKRAEAVRKTLFDVLKSLELDGDVRKPTPAPTRTPAPTPPSSSTPDATAAAAPTPGRSPTAAPAAALRPSPAPAEKPGKPGTALGVPGVRAILPEGVWTARELQKSEGSGFLELTARRGGKMFAYLYALEGTSSDERLAEIAKSVAKKVSSVVVDGGRGEGACRRYELQVAGDVTYLDACPIVKQRASVLVLLFSTRGDAPIRESARSGLVHSVMIDDTDSAE